MPAGNLLAALVQGFSLRSRRARLILRVSGSILRTSTLTVCPSCNTSPGCLTALPGKLADVQQAVHPAQVDKRAEGLQAADHAFAHLSFGQLAQELFLGRLFLPFDDRSPAEHQVAALGPGLGHNCREFHADKLRQVLDAVNVNLAGRDEGADVVHLALQAPLIVPGDAALRPLRLR